MTTNSILAALRARIEANPEDWDTRLIYADALEESGETIYAMGQRWQAKHKKRPYLHLDRKYMWFNKDCFQGFDPDHSSSILPVIFQKLNRQTNKTACYDSLPEAETDLAYALLEETE